jgi:hypothetical protein
MEERQLEDQTRIWLREGVIEKDPRIVWTNNPVFVAKKNGDIRVCIDCRPANAVTKTFNWPLPRLQDLRHHLRGAKWFSRIDLRNAFFRIGVPKEWRHLTAFSSGGQSYQFTRMPFGLKTAPAVFQRFMDHVLRKLKNICYWYMDDVLVFAESRRILRRNTALVLSALRVAGNQINDDKSIYEQPGLLFAGLWVYGQGVGPNFTKVKEVLALPVPRTKKDKQSALGMVSYLRDFIPLASMLTADLSGGTADMSQEELGKKWNELLKHIANTISSTSHWNEEDDADLYTDASGTGIAAVLIQNGRIIAVSSRKLNPAETRYSTTDREHLSLLLAAQKFKIFLHRPRGVTRTRNDHAALMDRKTNNMTPRQARWFHTIDQWIPNVTHIKGDINPADFFSRWGVEMTGGQICVYK